MGEEMAGAVRAVLESVKEHPFMIGISTATVCAMLCFLPLDGLSGFQGSGWFVPTFVVGAAAAVLTALGGAGKALGHAVARRRVADALGSIPDAELGLVREIYEAGGSMVVDSFDGRAMQLKARGFVTLPAMFSPINLRVALDPTIMAYLQKHADSAFSRLPKNTKRKG